MSMKFRGRCILFTTHYLDEADILASRKTVLDKGRIIAFGTSKELKDRFGIGYHLRIMVARSSEDRVASSIHGIVQRHIESATVEDLTNEARSEAFDAPKVLAFILPVKSAPQFGNMLEELERAAEGLSISDYSLEMTSLEEVFMTLGQLEDQDAHQHTVPVSQEQSRISAEAHLETHFQVDPNATRFERVPASNLKVVLAIAQLRVLQVFSDKKSLLWTLVGPILLSLQNANSTSQEMQVGSLGESVAEKVVAMVACTSGMMLSVSLAIALPWFVTSVVLDRVSRCTHVIVSQGVPLSAFWLGTFITNYIQLLLVSLAFPLFILVFQTPFYSDREQFVPILIAAFLAPLSMLLFGYNISALFTTSEGSAKFMPLVSLVCSIIAFFAVYITTSLSFALSLAGAEHNPPIQPEVNEGQSLHHRAVLIHILLSALDPYYVLPGTFLSIGLSQLPSLPYFEIVNGQYQLGEINISLPSVFGSYTAIPILGNIFVSVLLAINLVRDQCCRRQEIPWLSGAQPVLAEEEDADVAQERMRADAADPFSQALLYKNLKHTYGWGPSAVHAVCGISLGVPKGECFALLGPNGAGKTTTLDVMTGAIPAPTGGYVYISGHEVTGGKQSRVAAFKSLGHCPQVDPLWPTLSGRQHLQFYARVKGVPSHVANFQVDMILKALGFNHFDANKSSTKYSGGMKRKLSLAISLIGNPPLLLLDEPSAAVDAAAKRHLWRIVKARGRNQTVLLTTHSMEEAEALSDRLAVQVRGRLRCVGTPDHIKQTHGAGYQLELILPPRPPAAADQPDANILAFVASFANDHNLIEYHADRYLFQLPTVRAVGARRGELTPSQIFLHMHGRQAREVLGLRDFSLSRPSLEQVFLRFAKEQMEHDAES